MLLIILVFCVVLCIPLSLFVFVLCLVYPVLTLCLDFPFLIATSVFSNVYNKMVWFGLWCLTKLSTIHCISVISWWSVLLVEEIGSTRKKHRPVASHSETLSLSILDCHLGIL